MDLDTAKVRLGLITEAVHRSRAAFITVTIASLSVIVAGWNAYLSSYRNFAINMAQFSTAKATEEAQRELMEQWVNSLWISIAPLGIRIGISDAAVLGSLGIYIIAIWMYFCVRRENRAIANLFWDMRDETAALRELVQHAVVESMLFLSVKDDDEPIDRIEKVDQPAGRRAVFLRRSLTVLFYLPAIAVIGILILDVGSLFFIDAAFRDPHLPLFHGVMERKTALTTIDIIKLMAMTAIELVMAIATLSICRRILDFENATTKLIRQHQDSVKDPARS